MILNYLFTNPLFFIVWVFAILITLTVHEFAHGITAYYMGDRTAESAGRLSLNPLVHIDPIGFLMLLTIGFGWAKPVPVNPYNFRNYKWGEILVSLAGPASNFLFAGIFALILKVIISMQLLGPDNLLINFLVLSVFINIILMLFNLIPIPPLDGSHVLFVLLPAKYNDFKLKLTQYGPVLLLGILIFDSFSPVSIFGTIFSGVFNWVFRFLL